MSTIFISHSSRDNSLASDLANWLGNKGYSPQEIFLDFDHDSGISPGADWERTLYSAIKNCSAVLLIITPNWIASKWCFAEFAQARALGKSIFPIVFSPAGETFIADDIQKLDLTQDKAGGLEKLEKALTTIALDKRRAFSWPRTRPPYPGMMAFEESDAAVYFGRDEEARILMERLNARRVQSGDQLQVVLGASGTGKSSLIRAGVLPYLKKDGSNWLVLPALRPGKNPIRQLARSVAALIQSTPEADLYELLSIENAENAFVRWNHLLRTSNISSNAKLLITIDQAEELFTVTEKKHLDRFLLLIDAALSADDPAIVLMTLRSDYLDALQASALMSDFETFPLRPMPLDRISDIIRGPARAAGIEVDDDLVDLARRDAKTEEALPLLALALREMYERWGHSGRMTAKDYALLGDQDHGASPLDNIVRKVADDVVNSLSPSQDELRALEHTFVDHLVQINASGDYVRMSARWDAVPDDSHRLLEALCSARVLVSHGDGGVRTIDIAHEALLRHWPRLKSMLDKERSFLRWRTSVSDARREWEQVPTAGFRNEKLLKGLPLDEAGAWLYEKRHRWLKAPRDWSDSIRGKAWRRKTTRWRFRGILPDRDAEFLAESFVHNQRLSTSELVLVFGCLVPLTIGIALGLVAQALGIIELSAVWKDAIAAGERLHQSLQQLSSEAANMAIAASILVVGIMVLIVAVVDNLRIQKRRQQIRDMAVHASPKD